jgi:hypothetical protein
LYKPLLSAFLAIALLLPLYSAYAESFSVTTNKDLYTVDEKAIVVGIIPESAPEGYAVLLKVSGPDGLECSVQNILPDSDNSFVSRPLSLDDCGSGRYAITAYYAELSANSTFTVSNNTQTFNGDRLELRLLKNVAVQSQETVNQRLREFLESNQALPEDIADSYSLGVFEASIVLQAVDYGDTTEAKKHLILAVKHFRQVIDSMAKERIIFEQAIVLEASDDDSDEAVRERYQRVKEFYFRLEEVAQKNGIDNEKEFGQIVSLLAKSKQMIDDGEPEQANLNLDRANSMLEDIRSSLYGNRAEESTENATLAATDSQAVKLANVADKFERTALNILKNSNSEVVNATIQKALDLIAQARVDLQNGDYAKARSSLSAAFSALNEAKEADRETENEEDDSSTDDNRESSDSDKEEDKDDDEGEESSGSNGDDDSDGNNEGRN